MKTFRGICTLPRKVSGPAFLMSRGFSREHSPKGSPDQELQRFESALQKAESALGALEGDIYAAHREMLRDPVLHDSVAERLADGCGAEEAVREVCEGICEQFEHIHDEYLRARADDVRDVCARILSALSGATSSFEPGDIPPGAILFTEELFPSDLALPGMEKVAGIVCEKGSVTSHAGIMAKGRGVPVLFGIKGCCSEVSDGEEVSLEASSLQEFRLPSGCTLLGNAGCAEDVAAAVQAGASGIGLFRTEFLFIKAGRLLSEQEQYEQYCAALDAAGGRTVTFRTLDVGGDKPLPGLNLPHEDNPFLGLRAIRLCLARPDVFKPQLRSLLRCAAKGSVRILLPMVCVPSEIGAAKALIAECASELKSQGTPYAVPSLGAMIETPSAVFHAAEFSRIVDFFAIGTNDLTQYMLAADRGNPSVAGLYDVLEPSVLSAVRHVVESAPEGFDIDVCGEAASDSSVVRALYDCGIRRFSVSL